jgi:LacI family transcriptional regulator
MVLERKNAKGKPMKSPTLTDVARHAGVSYATADRVVNNRGRVSAKAVSNVQASVEKLQYVRNVAAANLSQGRRYRFVFVLPKGPNAFFQHMRALLADRNTAFQSVEVHEVAAFDAHKLAKHLSDLSGEPLDGVAVVGLDDDALIAPLQTFRAGGITTVALVADLPRNYRAAYVGIDNVAAGRTAGRLLGQSHGGQTGLVQIIVGNSAARDHSDRLAGFYSVLETDFPRIKLLPVVQSSDYGGHVEAQTRDILGQHLDLTAIYNAGAGNSGLQRAVQGVKSRPMVVAHELSPQARAALEAGHFDYIIDQQPDAEVAAALALLRACADGVPLPKTPAILPTIYVRDNLPSLTQQGPNPA